MPRFQKGQSGNPKGRPLAARGLRAALVALYGDDGAVLIERLEAMSRDDANPKIALAATELLLAYAFGKPTQAMELSTAGDEPLNVIQVVLAK